jgi:hypothetical protein
MHHVESRDAFQAVMPGETRLPRRTDVACVRRNRAKIGVVLFDNDKNSGGEAPWAKSLNSSPCRIDRTEQGLVAGEAFKCASPRAAIERAKGF